MKVLCKNCASPLGVYDKIPSKYTCYKCATTTLRASNPDFVLTETGVIALYYMGWLLPGAPMSSNTCVRGRTPKK